MVTADRREQASGREREKSLETERDFFASVLESADAFILVLDRDGCILQANRAVELAPGHADDELRGRGFISVFPIREAAPAFREGLRRLVQGAVASPVRKPLGDEQRRTAARRTALWHPCATAGGGLSHVMVTAADITGRRALEDELRAMSLRDDMTGLYNRRGFSLLAEQRLKDSRRSDRPWRSSMPTSTS